MTPGMNTLDLNFANAMLIEIEFGNEFGFI
jgi:hypothetical protein